jgi:hypothetical protein
VSWNRRCGGIASEIEGEDLVEFLEMIEGLSLGWPLN